jgi:multiple sugar transport system permease protein
MTASERRDLRNGLLFTSPWIVGATVFLVGPILFSLYASFCDYSVLRRPEWIGLSNYADLVSDEVFWKALANTLLFASMSIPLGLLVSLGLGFLLNTGVRGMTVFRTIFFLPSLVPMVALAIIWLWIFNGENGVLNYFVTSTLGLLGLKVTPPGWLTDPAWSKPALVMMSAWTVGHAVVIYLASLQDVPAQLYEAAELDGASYLQRLRYVTIPCISPVILFNLIMGIIGTLQTFAVPYVISPSGAPARSIYFLAMYLYDNAFPYLRMGYACAMAWILFVLILLLTLLALKVSSRHVHYGGM